MRKKDGQWFVISDGQWLEFAGKKTDIEWREKDENNSKQQQYGYNITKKRLKTELKPLTDRQLRVYLVLRAFADDAGYCYPSQQTIAEMTHKSRQMVSETVKELQKKRYILAVHKKKTKNGIVNAYKLEIFKE